MARLTTLLLEHRFIRRTPFGIDSRSYYECRCGEPCRTYEEWVKHMDQVVLSHG